MSFTNVKNFKNEQGINELADLGILKDKSILIDESLGQNCDFLLMELIKIFKFTIFQWNDSGSHFRNILKKYGVEAHVASIFDTAYNEEDIIDDVYTQRKLGYDFKSKINVFRSGTAIKIDYYDADIILKISNLDSGCTSQIDGTIKAFERDKCLLSLKYKILADKVVYLAD